MLCSLLARTCVTRASTRRSYDITTSHVIQRHIIRTCISPITTMIVIPNMLHIWMVPMINGTTPLLFAFLMCLNVEEWNRCLLRPLCGNTQQFNAGPRVHYNPKEYWQCMISRHCIIDSASLMFEKVCTSARRLSTGVLSPTPSSSLLLPFWGESSPRIRCKVSNRVNVSIELTMC